MVQLVPFKVPTIDADASTAPTATHVIELGQDTLHKEFNPVGRLRDPSGTIDCPDNLRSANGRAFINGETGDRVGWERRVLNAPMRTAVVDFRIPVPPPA